MYQLDAIQLSKNVHRRLTDFVVDDSFVRDPQLTAICERIWGGRPEAGGLISELWVEGAFPAKTADEDLGWKITTLDDLVREGSFVRRLGEQLHKTDAVPLDRPLYLHQCQAIRNAREPTPSGGRPALVVTAGTGSGKTESFLLPLLNDLYSTEPRHREGVECIILYPMNALVNDQVDRIEGWLRDQGEQPACTLFHMTSETPEDFKSASASNFPVFDPCRMRTRKQARGLESNLGRHIDAEDRTAPPRILITNYSMLEYMLCRPQDAPFFGANLRTIVLDEAHLYTGTLAAEMTLLLRRLLTRCGKHSDEVLQIATSATIGGDVSALRDFAAGIFSKDVAAVRLIEGENDHVTFRNHLPPPQAPTAAAICQAPWLDQPTLTQGDGERLALVTDEQTCLDLRDTLRLLVSDECIAAAMEQSANRPAALLYAALLHSPLMEAAEAILWGKRRLSVPDFASMLFGDNSEECLRATTRILRLGAASRLRANEFPLVPHRLHLLARTTAGLSVCLNPRCTGAADRRLGELGCVLEGVRDRCSHCHSAAVTLVRCNHCGEWALGCRSDGQRVRPYPERWEDGTVPPDLHVYSLKRPEHGTAVPIDADGVIREGGVALWQWTGKPDRNRSANLCANCGENEEWVPFITYDPLCLSTLAETVLAQLPRYPSKIGDWLPSQGRRLLAFSDSRVEAARLGPRLTRSHELQVFRAVLARELERYQVDADVLAYMEEELASERRKLDTTDLPASVRDRILHKVREYEAELSATQAGRTVGDWSQHLSSSPLIRQLMDDQLCERDEPIKWRLCAQEEWDKNTAAVGHDISRRLKREVARPARRQLSLETLGLAEVVYPRLDTLRPPAELVHELSTPDVRDCLHQHWHAFLALLCDDLRSKGCVTLGSEAEDDEYEFGKYLVGGWCALDKANVLTGLQRFSGTTDRQQRRTFAAAVLERCGMPADDAAKSAPRVLALAFHQLLFAAGWDRDLGAATLGPLVWLERGKRQVSRSDGGGSVEAIRIRLPELSLRRPKRLFECGVTRQLWARHAAGCAPEPSCRELVEISHGDADVSPRFGRLRGELLRSAVFEQGLWAVEHSAQLHPKENRRLQDLFKAGARNVLSSTTTLELGIDIGGLTAVLMGNMPPGKASYLQRAGRAGRRADGSSIVITFVRSRPFDREVFREFGKYLSQELRRPTIALERDRVGRRHFHAWLLNEFFRAIYAPYKHVGAMRAFGDMGNFCGEVVPDRWNGPHKPQLPLFRSEWSRPQAAPWWNERPLSPGLDQQFAAYLGWLSDAPGDAQVTAERLFGDVSFFQTKGSWNSLLAETRAAFVRAVTAWKQDYEALIKSWTEITPETDQQGKANALRYNLQCLYDLTVIEALCDSQFLPRYGFPIGVLKLMVLTVENEKDRQKQGRVREEDQFRLERPGLLALREYVPGTQLLVGGKLVTSRGVMKHWTGAATDDAVACQVKEHQFWTRE